jgi:Ca2+-binding EF-hand superfamily protein
MAPLPPPGPFVMVGSPEANRLLAHHLQERYGPRNKLGSQKLTRQDLGLDEVTFDQLDADHDGTLDGEELARFARRAPDLEFQVRLGRVSNKEAAIELLTVHGRPARLADRIRNVDGTLKFDFGNTQIELGQSESSTDVAFARVLRQQYQAQFRAADKDNNGYLDSMEAMQNPLFRAALRMMDRDGDGKLFEKELLAYLDKIKELQDGAMRSCASLHVRDQGKGLFDLIDTDHDGRLSVRELRQGVKLVESLDRDKDGAVSPAEIPHKYRVEVQRGPATSNQFAPQIVQVRRMAQPGPNWPERTAGPLWFRKMDRNHDGDVSRREFLGTDEEFRRIDADGDGLISAQEAERADHLFRMGP